MVTFLSGAFPESEFSVFSFICRFQRRYVWVASAAVPGGSGSPTRKRLRLLAPGSCEAWAGAGGSEGPVPSPSGPR